MPEARTSRNYKGAIAVDLDDTLNDFSATMQRRTFADAQGYNLPHDKYAKYLAMVRRGEDEPSELLSTEYSYFRQRIHMECFEWAQPLDGAVEFMQWLRAGGWRIVILTHRDLRRAGEVTRKWLDINSVPFDCLFMTVNKVGFCRKWGIKSLIDDHWVNFQHWQPGCGVEIFYPRTEKNEKAAAGNGRAYDGFGQLRKWICG